MRPAGGVEIDVWGQGQDVILEAVQRSVTRSHAVAVAMSPAEAYALGRRLADIALRMGHVPAIKPCAVTSFKPAKPPTTNPGGIP